MSLRFCFLGAICIVTQASGLLRTLRRTERCRHLTRVTLFLNASPGCVLTSHAPVDPRSFEMQMAAAAVVDGAHLPWTHAAPRQLEAAVSLASGEWNARGTGCSMEWNPVMGGTRPLLHPQNRGRLSSPTLWRSLLLACCPCFPPRRPAGAVTLDENAATDVDALLLAVGIGVGGYGGAVGARLRELTALLAEERAPAPPPAPHRSSCSSRSSSASSNWRALKR